MTPIAAVQNALSVDRRHADPAIWIAQVDEAVLLEHAGALQAEGPLDRPLWGLAFAVKDNIDVAGMPTTAACPGYAYTPATSALAVQRLHALGNRPGMSRGEDGPCLGFLAEAAGTAGAPDITSYGGWRTWLADRNIPR